MQELINACEEDLRQADAESAIAKLRKVRVMDVPREFALPFANLCRRAGLISLSLRVLTPILLPQRSNAVPAHAREKAEYAVGLQRIGAVREAAEILHELEPSEVPEALLYEAFCCFNQWRYADAIPLLTRYLSATHTPYQDLVGRTNLAAALVATTRLDEAESLLDQNIESARGLGFRRLEGNGYELRAQIHLQRGDFASLERDLALSETCLRAEGGFESLFVEKWRSVAEAVHGGSTTRLEAFKATARANGDWENQRDADRYLLKARFDEDQFHHLVFGSPNPVFRAEIFASLGRRPSLAAFARGNSQGPCFDVQHAKVGERSVLEVGQKPHQLMCLLAGDFYKSFSFGELFSDLYADEKFNIFSSPGRLHQLFHRLRAALEDSPVVISEADGSYRLSPAAGGAILVPLEMKRTSANDYLLERVRSRFAERSFSSQEATENLDLSDTSFRRFAQWAIAGGQIERIGQGYRTRYFVRAAVANSRVA